MKNIIRSKQILDRRGGTTINFRKLFRTKLNFNFITALELIFKKTMDDGMREYLRSLQASIDTQEVTIEGLRGKNKRLEEKLLTAESYSEELRLQVQNLSKEVEALKSELLAQKEKFVKSDDDQTSAMMPVENVAEEITKAASEVVHEQFLKSMVYEKTSGLYYDQNSGYYYDATKVSKIKSIYNFT